LPRQPAVKVWSAFSGSTCNLRTGPRSSAPSRPITWAPRPADPSIAQYRQWQLKDYSLGDLKTELNGSTIVVTYTMTLNGTAGSQPLPSTPQHMMTVWQQQKAGWVAIAHSATQP
jgi:hypothetical protein